MDKNQIEFQINVAKTKNIYKKIASQYDGTNEAWKPKINCKQIEYFNRIKVSIQIM